MGLGFGVVGMKDFCVCGGRGGVNGGGTGDENEGAAPDGAVVAYLCFPGGVGGMILLGCGLRKGEGLGQHGDGSVD